MRKFLSKVSPKEIESFNRILLFKHSRTCPVSARALNEVERFMDQDESAIPIVLIDVLSERSYSAELATYLDLKHESPQLIFLEEGKMIWNESHFRVTESKIRTVTDS